MPIPTYAPDFLTTDEHAIVRIFRNLDYFSCNSNIVGCTSYNGPPRRRPSMFDDYIPQLLDERLVTNRDELGLMLPTRFELSQNSRFSHYKHSFFINIPNNDRVLFQIMPYSLKRSYCRIDYRPSHLNPAATKLLLEWFHIIFKELYPKFVSRVYVSRVDWAYDFPGLDCGNLCYTVNNKRKGKSIRNNSTKYTESFCVGGNSSKENVVMYDKELQLNFRKLPQLYPGYANTPRVEFKQRFYKADQITLAKLAKIDWPFDDVQLFNIDRKITNRALREIHNQIREFGLFSVLKQLPICEREILLEHLRPFAIFPWDTAAEYRAFSKEVEAKLMPFFDQLD